MIFKHHFSQKELSLLEEIADSWSVAGNVQNVPRTFVIMEAVIKNHWDCSQRIQQTERDSQRQKMEIFESQQE